MLIGKLADLVVQTQRVLHVRRHQHHRAVVAFGHLRHQSGAGCAGQLAKLALIAGFDRQ
ncbi:hypothetical protein MJK71_11275 [Escherichia coli]|nr:hypothetical protein MJK71_11275 [Escherichia coli]